MIAVQRKKRKYKEYFGNALVTIWPFVGWLIFSAVPLVLSFVMMFYKMPDSSFAGAEFVGLRNIADFFTKYKVKLGYSLLNTLLYTLKLPIGIVLSIWISVLLSRITKFKRILRAIFFIPYVCSISVIIISFRTLLDESSGVFNQLLNNFGFEGFRWLTKSPWTFHLSALLIGVWSSIGYNVVMFQAAIANIDESYYEAARIDGASDFVQFWRITLPGITPILSFVITTGIIGCFQAYAETYILAIGTNGIPEWSNSQFTGPWVTVAMWIYNMMFQSPAEYGFGMAAAAGWILAIVIFVIIRINLKLQEKWVSYDF